MAERNAAAAETRAYRVPLARLLQEEQEEARLLPGLRRTDEAVHNVPGLGKNRVRSGGPHRRDRAIRRVHDDGAQIVEVADEGNRRAS
ncbi:MAG: hypothetical protein HY744_17610 [Deltaproteobacteria bacterium]|nr:hypothetical protein [Deltaproteobacteria bacterium]